MRGFIRTTGWIFTITAAAIMLWGACGRAVAAESAEDLLKITEEIKNETPGITIEFWREDTKTRYKPGDSVVFGFKVDKDCYVAIIDVGTSGKATILFPNKWRKDNKAEKGKTYLIPPEESKYQLKINGPAGLERVKVVACLDPILGDVASFQDELKDSAAGNGKVRTFLAMKNPGLVLKDIAAVLKKVDPKKWAAAEMTFDVEEK